MSDYTETVVLPEDELARRRPVRHPNERDDVDAKIVSPDELEAITEDETPRTTEDQT